MAELVTGLKNPELGRKSEAADQPSISPRHLRSLIRQGNAARDRRNWREAVRLYGLVIEASPSSLAIQVQLGHAHKELGDFDRADINYHTVLEQTPTDDDLHLQIGHLEKLKGNLQEAAAYYRKSVELNPRNTNAVVEYHALAAKLRLPPLPAPSVADDQGLIAAVKKGAIDPDLKRFFERVNHNSLTSRSARRITDKRLLHVTRRFRQGFSAVGAAPAQRTPTADLPVEHNWSSAALKNDGAAPSAARLPLKVVHRPKVLFVSDSLGTPIHARGIFHYSVALVEILSRMGFETTLVIEKSPEYGLPGHTLNTRWKLSQESIDCYNLAEICRYFNGDVFSFRWKYEDKFQRLVEKSPFRARLATRVHELLSPRVRQIVDNFPNRMQMTPDKGPHLRKFDRFLWIDRFYSDSMTRAVNDLIPVDLNAVGYDLVIIDTPHYVKVRHIDRSRTFVVVHDFIPLVDPFMGPDWRQLFLGKLRASLAAAGNLIFVSEYTQSLFHSLFPRYAPRRELVLHPSIAKHWVERASQGVPHRRSAYIATIGQSRVKDRRALIRDRATRLTSDPEKCAALVRELEAKLPSWNGALPYFATVCSDEPRKNIAIFCTIAPRFAGRANFVIIGQIDGNRYMNYEPELYPNLHFTGYLADDEKADVMRHAAGVIFPSFSEGFGIPIVEGAVLGVPVLCSNLPVFHEITQNLATYFDPHSADELAMRVNELLADRTAYAESARRLRELVLKRFSQEAMQRRFEQSVSESGVLTVNPDRHGPAVSGCAPR